MNSSTSYSALRSVESSLKGNTPATLRSYGKNEFIYLDWENVENIYVINSGFVKLGYYSDEGKERISAILSDGDLLGNLSMRAQSVREYAQTLTKANITIIDTPQYTTYYSRQPEFLQKIIHSLEDRYYFAEQQMRTAAFMDVRSRVIFFLKFLANSYGKNFGGVIHIPNFLTHEDIANFNLTSRQTVTMILAELRRNGAIHYDRHQIKIFPEIYELAERKKVS